MRPAQGLVIGGKLELLRPLAEGGMGALWVAHHRDLDIEVAVKFMANDLADEDTGRRRFRREAKAAAKLRSPHVAQVLDYGVDDNTPYIVMELLEGMDLATLLAKHGALSPKRSEAIVRQLVRALNLAHHHGIVHRDLKPSNVFVARVGDEEIVKILDFGIAKHGAVVAEGDNTTQAGSIVGSPRYMSPEQTVGDPVDHRSDLWSLAVVLFEMLTLSRPFEGRTVGRIISRVCSRPPPKAAALEMDLPERFDAFFERALHKNCELRFQSGDELVEAFHALATGASIPPPQPRNRSTSMGRDADTVDLDPDVASSAQAESRISRDLTSPGLGVDTPPAMFRTRPRWHWGAAALAIALIGYVALRDDAASYVARPALSPSATTASATTAPPASRPSGADPPSSSAHPDVRTAASDWKSSVPRPPWGVKPVASAKPLASAPPVASAEPVTSSKPPVDPFSGIPVP